MSSCLNSATLRALSIAFIGAASSVHAETITVCPDGSCDFTDPAAAVNAAIEGDTIEIAAGTYLLSAPLSLYDKDLVIRGAIDANGRPTTVLNGQNTTYQINALQLTAATVIENLVLTNGRGTNSGALYMFGCAATTFRNCSVRGNRATYGGAIKLNSSSVTMIGCEILDNAGESGSTVGGGIYVAGSISLIDCVVSGNSATYSGGGVYLPSGAVANLTNTRVCGNIAPNGEQIGQSPSGLVNDLGGSCVMTVCASCPTPPACAADLNNDRTVNAVDLATVLAAWGPCGKSCSADINGDGVVSAVDIATVLDAWGACD